MITFYPHIKTGIFNGFVTNEKGSTVEGIVQERIIGETCDTYVVRILTHSIPYWDDMGRYEASMCSPIGIHKSRLIKWTFTQLELF